MAKKHTEKDDDIKRLYRSKNDRMIAGVCGGIAEYLNVDSVWIRLIAVLLIFFKGIGLLIYIILAILVPENPYQKETKEKKDENKDDDKKEKKLNEETMKKKIIKRHHQDKQSGIIIGIVLIIIGLLFLIQNFFYWITWSYIWPVLIILLGLILLFNGD